MMIQRREAMAGIGLGAIAGHSGLAFAAQRDDAPASLETAAYDAYLYTLPLIESATARAGWVGAGGRYGSFLHQRVPTTPAMQRITTPNNDTLNSRAWIDLGRGPVRFTLPATGSRYVSAAMMDMFSNNFAVLGSRTTGPDGGTFTIVGPDAAGPPGAIRSPTRWMWILVRLLVNGTADLPAANALQDRYGITTAPQPAAVPEFSRRDADATAYFTSAAQLLRENPGPATDTGLIRRIAPLGLDQFDAKAPAPGAAAQIAAGVARARATLSAQSVTGPLIDGWTYPRSNLGDFGQDYLYRAQTAINAFAALPIAEALYAFGMAPDGKLSFDSARAWRLRLDRDALPPNDAFWSLVMYRATPDGQFFLFDNPIDRYSIGDRTPGLVRDADGGLTIAMQRTPAPSALNWLPTPTDGPFGIVFRIFRPRQVAIDGQWRLPRVTPA